MIASLKQFKARSQINFKYYKLAFFVALFAFLIKNDSGLIGIIFILTILTFGLCNNIKERIALLIAFIPFTLMWIPMGIIYLSIPDILMLFIIFNYFFLKPIDKKPISIIGGILILLIFVFFLSFIFSKVQFATLGMYLRSTLLFTFLVILDCLRTDNSTVNLYLKALAFTFPTFVIMIIFNGEYINVLAALFIPNSRIEYSQFGQLCFTFTFLYFLIIKKSFLGIFVIPIYIFTAIKGQSQFMTLATALVSLLFISSSFGKKYSLFFLLSLLLFFIFSGYSKELYNYMSELIADREFSNDFRFDKMNDSILIFKDNPILGSGPNSEIFVSKSLASSENTYTQVLAELGILGFFLFGVLHLIAFWRVSFFLKFKNFLSKEFLILIILIIGSLGPLLWTSGFFVPIIWISFYVMNLFINHNSSFR